MELNSIAANSECPNLGPPAINLHSPSWFVTRYNLHRWKVWWRFINSRSGPLPQKNDWLLFSCGSLAGPDWESHSQPNCCVWWRGWLKDGDRWKIRRWPQRYGFFGARIHNSQITTGVGTTLTVKPPCSPLKSMWELPTLWLVMGTMTIDGWLHPIGAALFLGGSKRGSSLVWYPWSYRCNCTDCRGYWGASPCGWLTRHDSELNVTTLLLAATLHYSLHFSHLFSFKRRQRRFC